MVASIQTSCETARAVITLLVAALSVGLGPSWARVVMAGGLLGGGGHNDWALRMFAQGREGGLPPTNTTWETASVGGFNRY